MKKLFIFPLLLLLFSQYGEDDYVPPKELPPLTTTGENTFGCKINGVNWQVGQKIAGPDLRVDASVSTGLIISANNDEAGISIGLGLPTTAAQDGTPVRLNWPPPPEPLGGGCIVRTMNVGNST